MLPSAFNEDSQPLYHQISHIRLELEETWVAISLPDVKCMSLVCEDMKIELMGTI